MTSAENRASVPATASEVALRRWPNPAPATRRIADEAWEHPDTRYGFEQGASWQRDVDRKAVETARAIAREGAFSESVEVRTLAGRIIGALAPFGYDDASTGARQAGGSHD